MSARKQMGSTRRRRSTKKPRSSGRVEYNTPARVLDCVRKLGRIDLDPCSNPRSLVNARRTFDEAQDGLAHDWKASLVYVNPPYGRSLLHWMKKIAVSMHEGHSREIVALLPASTDTAWGRAAIEHAQGVCFVAGRIAFVGMTAGAFFPSLVFYFGPRFATFKRAFAKLGVVRPLNRYKGPAWPTRSRKLAKPTDPRQPELFA